MNTLVTLDIYRFMLEYRKVYFRRSSHLLGCVAQYLRVRTLPTNQAPDPRIVSDRARKNLNNKFYSPSLIHSLH